MDSLLNAIGNTWFLTLYSPALQTTTADQPHPQNPLHICATFTRIARRYDLANHLLSVGLDFGWRKKVAHLVSAHQPRQLLDLATGSGDLALTLARHCPGIRIVAGDFCLPMLREAQKKQVPRLVGADGMKLPFAESTFDALTVAFGLRNMASYPGAVAEFQRVLRPGGMLVVLDFSMPRPWLAPFYRFYLRQILPRVAGLLTGDRSAYEYLGESIEAFPQGPAMLSLLEAQGFHTVCARQLACGIVTLYHGFKNPAPFRPD